MAVEIGASDVEPVVRSVVVGIDPEAAFELFTVGMGTWWPLHTHSIAADTFEGRVTVTELVFEAHPGGSIYEVMSDGTKGEWGKVLEWEPPGRVVFSWKPNLEDVPPTEVEVTFIAVDDGTDVRLEHRGWERLGERGAVLRRGYEQGWPTMLSRFAQRTQRDA
ncbi:MAG: SRPBCC domain-containing protein, partial [Actinomycetota bacterium]